MTICIDKKYTETGLILEKYKFNKSRLITILQEIQEIYGYLPEDLLGYVADSLKITLSHVYGVATFYSYFSLKPKGKYVIKICDGTACHVKGSGKIIDGVTKRFNFTKEKNTTDDNLFTLETVSCLGACGLAPVVMVNEDVHGEMNIDKMNQVIDEIITKEK